jgi:hypothetical protein
VHQEIDTYNASSYGLDAGALLRVNDTITLGAAFHNIIQPRLKLYQNEDVFPIEFRSGVCFAFANLILSLDGLQAQGRNPKLCAGAEYLIEDIVAVRAGIDETELTAGFGVILRGCEIGYAFSYHDAVSGFSDLGASHRFGITCRWGEVAEGCDSSTFRYYTVQSGKSEWKVGVRKK